MIKDNKITDKGLLMLSLVVVVFGLLVVGGVQTDLMNFGGGATGYMVGTGSFSDPFIIMSCTDLQNIQNDLTAFYILGKDLDCIGVSFSPISSFQGSLDGNDFSIFNLNIQSSSAAGIFSTASDAYVSDINLFNAVINGSSHVGAIVGEGSNVTIENVVVFGSVTSYQNNMVGGIVGWAKEGSFLSNLYFNGDIFANTSSAGGVVGNLVSNSQLFNSFSYGSVHADIGSWGYAGGLVGSIDDSYISESYSLSYVTSISSSLAGPLVGKSSGSSSCSDSFWSSSKTPLGSSNLCSTGDHSLFDLQQESTFNNWDFISTWIINDYYPQLRSMDLPSDITLTLPVDDAVLAGDKYNGALFSGIQVVDPYYGQEVASYLETHCEFIVGSVSKYPNYGTYSSPSPWSNYFYVNPESSGAGFWTYRCTSRSGAISEVTRSAFFDDIPPTVDLVEPVDNFISTSNVVNLKFTPVDIHSPYIYCRPIVDGVPGSIVSVTNDSLTTFFTTFVQGIHNWSVDCYDEFQNGFTTSNRTINISLAPAAPIVESLPVFTLNPNISIIGHINLDNIDVKAIAMVGPSTYYNYTTSGSLTTDLGSTSLISVLSNNSFEITNSLSSGFDTGDYVSFENHNKSALLNYEISSVSLAGSTRIVTLFDDFEEVPLVGENTTSYDSEYPTGWFNISLTLIPGLNTVKVWGINYGVLSQEDISIISLDYLPPFINTSNLLYNYSVYPNVSVSNNFVNFTLEDDSSLDLSSLFVNFSNSTNDVLLFSGSGLICTQISTNPDIQSCELDISNFEEGNYTLTIGVNDTATHQTNETISNYRIIRSYTPTGSIEDEAQVTSDNYIYVNWSVSPLFLDHFDLALFNDAGNVIVDWFELNSSFDNYTFTMQDYPQLTYGVGYFARLIPYDVFGNAGEVMSTDGIMFEDTSAPVAESVRIILNQGHYVTSSNSLSLEFNFTDNETGIGQYEYAIGTAQYPDVGWDSVKPVTQTNLSSFVDGGLSLLEGGAYYVSARAKNTYPYAAAWSVWISSTVNVTLDSEQPYSGAIAYQIGPRAVGSINVTYNVGLDDVSGISPSGLHLMQDRTPFVGGQCQSFPNSFLTEANNQTPLVLGLNETEVSGLDSGYCYVFRLDVTDNAGLISSYSGGSNYAFYVDTTPPTPLTVNDEGFFSPDTSLQFTWTGGEDLESTIDHYSYRLGELSSPASIVDWTDVGLSSSLSLSNLNLTDGTTYYLEVSAMNGFGLTTNATSNGVLYLDMITPSPLVMDSVGKSTPNVDYSYPYVDNNSGLDWTVVSLFGESALNCFWSFNDEYYQDINDSGRFCNDTFGLGNYNCNVTGLTEGPVEVHISCSDTAGNAQTSSTNTDVYFMKEMQGPIINVTYPSVDLEIVQGVQTDITLDVLDASPWNSGLYNLFDIVSGTYLNSSVPFIGSIIPMDLSLYNGEVRLEVTIFDSLGRAGYANRTFIVNNDAPYVSVLNVNANNYLNETFYDNGNFNLTIESYFFSNLDYNITAPNGTVVLSGSYENLTAKEIHRTTNVSIDTTGNFSDEGVYILTATVRDFLFNFSTITREIIIDTTAPMLYHDTCDVTYGTVGHDICTLPDDLYESTNPANILLIWQDEYGMDENNMFVWYDTSNVTGFEQNITAYRTTDGDIIYPDSNRYVVDASGKLKTNRFVNYTWFVSDLAGNVPSSFVLNFSISNAVPEILSNNVSSGLVGEDYDVYYLFNDEDLSQHGNNFSCDVNDTSNFSATMDAYGFCRLSNNSVLSAGNYTINVTVTDYDDTNSTAWDTSSSRTLIVEIHPSTTLSVIADSQSTIYATMTPGGSSGVVSDSAISGDNLTLFVQADVPQTLRLTSDDFFVEIDHVNVSENVNFSLQKINPAWVDSLSNATMDWSHYTIHSVFGAELNFTNETYKIGFDLSQLGITKTPLMELFQYQDYNLTGDRINYSSKLSPISGTSLIEDGDVVYLITTEFSSNITESSLFVLATNDGTASTSGTLPNTPGVTGGNGGSSGGSSGGYYRPPAPADNCSDGLLNQDETGIDCGGICTACVVEEPEVRTSSTETSTSTSSNSNNNQQTNTRPRDTITPPSINNPSTVDTKTTKTGNLILWIVMLVIAIGAIGAFVVESHRRHEEDSRVRTTGHITGAHPDDDVVHLVKYITKQKSLGYNETVIRRFLVNNEYSEENVDAAIGTLKKYSEIEDVKKYFLEYQKQGYDIDNLELWLLDQGTDAAVVAIARDELTKTSLESTIN